MEIVLRKISEETLGKFYSRKRIILYGDFNVLNHLYDSELTVDNDIIIYPDSTVVFFLLKYLKKFKLKKNVSTDIQNILLKNAIKGEKRIFFFGDSEENLIKMRSVLLDPHYYRFYPGYNFRNEEVLQAIDEFNPHILFVGLGVGLQEKWILENYEFIHVSLIISVGGWFAYLAGARKRAPLQLRKHHLEWLHKLFFQFPRVWYRYFVGIPLFLFRVTVNKIKISYVDEDIVI